MNLRHIRTFVTVAEEGTVSKAALRLRVAQPALSRQISDFEGELGLRLFDRVHRRLVLTGEGERLLADCRGILAATEALGDRARMMGRADTGVLKVAATMLDDVLGAFLHRYAEHFPAVQVRLSDIIGPADLFTRLESGDLHLGIGLLRSIHGDTHGIESSPLPAVHFVGAAHVSVALGTGVVVEVSDLARFPLLLLSPTFEVRKSFDDACRAAGLEPRIVMESRLSHTLLALAEAGHGVAIGPSTLPIHRYRLRVARVVHEGTPLQEPLAVMRNGNRPLPRYAMRFCELLEAYMREVFPNLQAPASVEGRARGLRR
jgi:LysR family nitrogen assimilation transcriptional regulator